MVSACLHSTRHLAPAILGGILAISTVTLNAQKPPSQQLTVNVTDQYGAVMPGAIIAITDTAGVLKTAAYSKADGSALFPLTAGHYVLSARAYGFRASQQEIDFPKTDLLTLPLAIDPRQSGYQGPCCFAPDPSSLIETTQPVITAFIEAAQPVLVPPEKAQH